MLENEGRFIVFHSGGGMPRFVTSFAGYACRATAWVVDLRSGDHAFATLYDDRIMAGAVTAHR